MRLTQLAQVMPTTGRVSSDVGRSWSWLVKDTTGEYLAASLPAGSACARSVTRRPSGRRYPAKRRRWLHGFAHQARDLQRTWPSSRSSNDVTIADQDQPTSGRCGTARKRRSSSSWTTTSRRSSCCATSRASPAGTASASRAWRRCARPSTGGCRPCSSSMTTCPTVAAATSRATCAPTLAWTASRSSCARRHTAIRQAEIGSWAPVVSKPFDLGEIEALPRGRRASQRRRPRVRGSGRLG